MNIVHMEDKKQLVDLSHICHVARVGVTASKGIPKGEGTGVLPYNHAYMYKEINTYFLELFNNITSKNVYFIDVHFQISQMYVFQHGHAFWPWNGA